MNEYQTAKIPQRFGLCKQNIAKYHTKRQDDKHALVATGIVAGQAMNK